MTDGVDGVDGNDIVLLDGTTAVRKRHRRPRMCRGRFLVPLVISTILLVILSTTLITFLRTKLRMQWPVQPQCSSNGEECFQLLAKMEQNLNQTVDPCFDFVEYACSDSLLENGTTNEYYRHIAAEFVMDFLLKISADDPTISSSQRKAMAFFKHCNLEKESCFNLTLDTFELPLAQAFVEREFGRKFHKEAKTLVENVRNSFIDLLENIEMRNTFKNWYSRYKATSRVGKVYFSIALPYSYDQIEDIFDDLKIHGTDHKTHKEAVEIFEIDHWVYK